MRTRRKKPAEPTDWLREKCEDQGNVFGRRWRPGMIAWRGHGEQDGNEFVHFALAEDRKDRRAAKEEISKVGERSRIWKRAERKRLEKASAVNDAGSVFCAKREGALLVVDGVVAGGWDVI